MNDDLIRKKYFVATPAGICEAARSGNIDAIESILATKPELLSIDNPHNWTKTVDGHEVGGSFNKKPVEVAAFFNQGSAVTTLLQIGHASHEMKQQLCGGYFNSLRVALAMGSADAVEAIRSDIVSRIDADSTLLNAKDDNGLALIQYAADQGDWSLVSTLLNRGAPADPEHRAGKRVIYAVVGYGDDADRLALAKQLIERGANYNLWLACVLGDIDRTKDLLAHDPSLANRHFRPDQADLTFGYPLVPASRNGHGEIVALLLAAGADVNATLLTDDPAEFGMPLYTASSRRYYEIGHLLLITK